MRSVIVEIARTKQIARARLDVLQSRIPRLVLRHHGGNRRYEEDGKCSHLIAYLLTGKSIIVQLTVKLAGKDNGIPLRRPNKEVR
jgi:hypothetical protein